MSAECGDWQREISVSLPYGKQGLWSGAGVGKSGDQELL